MLNKCILIGNVGKTPEIRTTQDGREIGSFSLATSDSWKDKNTGERKEKTEWHKIVVFNPGIIEVIKKYVKKGSKLYIEGSLQTRKWSKDDVDHYTTEVILQGFGSSLRLLGDKAESQTQNKQEATQSYSSPQQEEFPLTPALEAMLNDEVPF